MSTSPSPEPEQERRREIPIHRRSGVLKTTPENVQLSRQRSQALYSMCCKGEIGLDTILSIPIDWQSVAMQYQLKEKEVFAIIVGEELIPTSTPLQVRYRLKPRQDTNSPSTSEPIYR